MLAVDTNIVVRLLTGDDADQHVRARDLFESETVFLPKTVLLEAEWVLRRAYRLPRIAVLDALEQLVSLPNARCEDEPAVRHALDLARAGMDFADALHLASSRSATRFSTFDAGLIKVASAHGLAVVAA